MARIILTKEYSKRKQLIRSFGEGLRYESAFWSLGYDLKPSDLAQGRVKFL